jgi:hypothetical protein
MSEGLFGLFGGGAADPWAATTTAEDPLAKLRLLMGVNIHGDPKMAKAIGQGVGDTIGAASGAKKSPFSASSEKSTAAPAPAAPPPPQLMDPALIQQNLKPPPPAAAGKKDKFGGIYGQSPFGPGPT